MAIPQEVITELLTLVVQIIIAAVGGFIINYIRTKIGTERMNQYYNLAKIVVTSIEQTIGKGNGADKKEEACQALKHLIKGKLTEEQIERLVEAAVYEMNIILKTNNLKGN